MQHPRAYIGTSGWNYKDWRQTFYPHGLSQRDWLSFLATEFDTVEINNTFYRIPKREFVERWALQVPRRFRFAVKIWRGITQFKMLSGCRKELESFFATVTSFPNRQRGPILVQLPPSQARDLSKLDAFLEDVRRVTAPSRWKIAVEFRHQSWLCDEVFRLLDRQHAAICLHDMPGRAPVSVPNDSSFIYIRRHGPTGTYHGLYPQEQIGNDARRARDWLSRGKTVYVYFNNDADGHAVTNARQLRSAVAGR